jgi:hypothetical protein
MACATKNPVTMSAITRTIFDAVLKNGDFMVVSLLW